ncbi:hypothetical protein CMV_002356 [Castanea mollissima]|uniref:Uncharacterized protein n=1 Tax=Castanea mollissima TaxID=60419 RepID=A0A8J4RQB8_9ROSI|nr:hypothetical protein CMV_002356 [Castanea mollissima]
MIICKIYPNTWIIGRRTGRRRSEKTGDEQAKNRSAKTDDEQAKNRLTKIGEEQVGEEQVGEEQVDEDRRRTVITVHSSQAVSDPHLFTPHPCRFDKDTVSEPSNTYIGHSL